MEIVIKIDDETYKEIKKSNTIKEHLNKVDWSIRNGTPLPKGHDRLVEARAVIKALFGKQTIDDVPTIIEADKG